MWVTDARWKEVVRELLGEVSYAVLVMGDLDRRVPHADPTRPTPRAEDGLRWEARTLFGSPDSCKMILVMPPVDEEHAAARWRRYRELSFGRMPPYEGGELAAIFRENGMCEVARISKSGMFKKTFKRDVYAYQAMLQVRTS